MTRPSGKSKRKSKKQKRARVGITAKKSSQAKARTRRKVASDASPIAAGRSIDDLVDAGALALGLPLGPAWRAGVSGNLEVILRQASLLVDFPLPDECEPAPIFRA